VVRVVIAGGQRVGTEHDPALDLGPEARRPGALVHLGEGPPGTALAQPVAHAIVAGEVRRRLRRGDEVVGGDGVLGMRQRDGLDDGAQSLELTDGRTNGGIDLGLHPLDEVLLRETDAQAAYAASERGAVAGTRAR